MIRILLLLFLFTFLSQEAISQDPLSKNNHSFFGLKIGVGKSQLRGLDDMNSRIDRLPGTNIPVSDFEALPLFGMEVGFSYQLVTKELRFLQLDLKTSLDGSRLKGVSVYGENNNKVGNVKSILLHNYGLTAMVGKKFALSPSGKHRFLVAIGVYTSAYPRSEYPYYSKSKKFEYKEELLKEGINLFDADINWGDFGGAFMTGFEIDKVQLSLKYEHGLVKIMQEKYNIRNSKLKFAVSYYFLSDKK